METTMHNLISFNQLAGSKHTFDPQNDKSQTTTSA